MSSSSSTSNTSGRMTESGGGLSTAARIPRNSALLRSKRRGGALIRNFSRYEGGALQKHVRQFVQTSVRSFVRQLHKSESMASKDTRQLKQRTAYARTSSPTTTSGATSGLLGCWVPWLLGCLATLVAASGAGGACGAVGRVAADGGGTGV